MDGAGLLRSQHDDLMALLVESIAQHIPDFNTGVEDRSHPLRRQRQKVLRLCLTGMAEAIEARHRGASPAWDWGPHRELGRMECRYGRPLSDILRAPWAASRSIVDYAVRRADDLDLVSASVQEIAEVVIDWSDLISIAISEGYNDESAARAGELETRRRTVLELALLDPPATARALEAAAEAAQWQPPQRVRVLVVQGPDRGDFRRGLPPGSLAAELGQELCALVPDHSSPFEVRREVPDGTVAAVGTVTGLVDASRSAALARRAISLARAGVVDGNGIIDCTRLDLALVVFADATAASELSSRVLTAAATKPDLIPTLAAWLACDGRPKATAARLGVHPHTVSYRLGRLRQLLGPVVDDPDRRTELHLATWIAAFQRRPPVSGDPDGRA